MRLCVLAIFVFVAVLGGVATDFAGASEGVVLVVMFVLEWGYYIFFESLWSGQTPGKKAMGLRTVKEGGYPITFIDVVLRNLLRGADWLPAFNVVGLTVMAFDSRFRRLGDMVAGTMVVSEERSRIGAALQINPPPTPEELEWIPASARLDGSELDALELYLRRVGTLSPARESELAEIVAPVFARRFGVQYNNAGRFLAVLYVRAGGGHAIPEPVAPPPRRKRKKKKKKAKPKP